MNEILKVHLEALREMVRHNEEGMGRIAAIEQFFEQQEKLRGAVETVRVVPEVPVAAPVEVQEVADRDTEEQYPFEQEQHAAEDLGLTPKAE